MTLKHVASKSMRYLRIGLTSLALFQFSIGGPLASSVQAGEDPSSNTRTPIKTRHRDHRRNRSFDHVFATYKPKDGEIVWNLLAEGIVKADGTPRPQFLQSKGATRRCRHESSGCIPAEFSDKVSFPNKVLPAPLVGGPKDSLVLHSQQ